MSEKVYSSLLILCGILSQGIIGSFSEENSMDSSDLLVRKKRLIDHTPEGDKPLNISQIPYIVKILKESERVCTGIILSPAIILTVDVCVPVPLEDYDVVSGAKYITNIRYHKILRKINKVPGHDNLSELALLILRDLIYLEPPSLNKKIDLYERPVIPNELATIAGWGPIRIRLDGVVSSDFLRAMEVPIISLYLCGALYRQHFEISNKNICTLDRSVKRRCSNGDQGAALLLDKKLAGVHIFPGKIIGLRIPDIFINLGYEPYNQWILSYISTSSQNQGYDANAHNEGFLSFQNEPESYNSDMLFPQ